MRIFLSGIIQGSRQGKNIHTQDYRSALKSLLARYVDCAEVICPIDLHPNSVDYDSAMARQTFEDMVRQASTADLVVAYLPEASMGTAVEVWQAHQNGVPVLTISQLADNWVIMLASKRVFPTIDAFEAYLASGGLREWERPA
jgi:hypothetical protein